MNERNREAILRKLRNRPEARLLADMLRERGINPDRPTLPDPQRPPQPVLLTLSIARCDRALLCELIAAGHPKVSADRRKAADIRQVNVFCDFMQKQTRTNEARLSIAARDGALLRELIDAGYRRLATERHPDRGGSADAMRELNVFVTFLRRQLAGAHE